LNLKLKEWVGIHHLLEVNPGLTFSSGLVDELKGQVLAPAGDSLFSELVPLVLAMSHRSNVTFWCKKCWVEEVNLPVTPVPAANYFTVSGNYYGYGGSTSTTGGYSSWLYA
jgi:hypothetical protein